MEYLRLFFYNRRLLSFGILLTFFSGFGKTFLVALYVKDFTKAFDLSTTSFSLLYAVATIFGGLLFIYFGKHIDSISLKKYTIVVVIALALSCLLLAVSKNVVFLLLGILGLRLTGQGLLTHISLTAMSQRFQQCRGKAISMAVMGHPLGEAVLPLLACYLIHFYSWRTSLFVSSAILLVLVIPSVIFLLKRKIKTVEPKVSSTSPLKKIKKGKTNWTTRMILLNKKFYSIAPNILTLAFLNAGILFFLVPIAKEKGWSESWIIHCFTAFGIGSFVAGIVTGSLIDRYRASKFFPFYLLPYAIGLVLIINFSSLYTAFLFLAMAGFTVGMASCIESSVIAEIYGTKSVGKVRSVYTAFSVLSSALGPLMLGILHDHHVHFNLIMKFGIGFILLSSLLSLRLRFRANWKSSAITKLYYRLAT